ncbi:hypothetical protein [Lunatimonas salinarum]|uniref:hypothetical protein n=1 Tax=Lunatimonas salinarum TaxID=1774590 RepID=UPI001AE0A4FD|nr:hypothetical protein [Lunatimonas salinarum]
MKELSILQMENIVGGTSTSNNCSNLGNGLAIGGMIVGATLLAIGPIGWGALLSFGLSYASVMACQFGYA